MNDEKEPEKPGKRTKRYAILLGGSALLATTIAFGINQLNQEAPQQTAIEAEQHAGLASAASPELRKLAEYERLYGPVTNELMIFSETPADTAQAAELASDMAVTLQEFEEYDIEPLVVFEPTTPAGPLDFETYATGAYDATLREYFAALKAAGVTNEMMGTWVLFAEANTPAWRSTTDPKIIASGITRTAQALQHEFAEAKTALLLDNKTYVSDDINWAHGKQQSLVRYVTDIPSGIIDRFGIQGFPWVSPGEEAQVEQLEPPQFINADLAIETAAKLGAKDIWFNTGTFANMYTKNPAQTISASPSQRQALLNGILGQANRAKQAGYNVSINLFSANKSQTDEAVDWSYERSEGDQDVFKEFVRNVQERGISLSLYDSEEL